LILIIEETKADKTEMIFGYLNLIYLE